MLERYEPPEAEFLLPDIQEAKHKSAQPLLEPSDRAAQVTYIDIAPPISRSGVRGQVTSVAHGTHHSQAATLIVFSFSLRSGGHGFRFKNANFRITFAKHPSAARAERHPSILKFAPRKIYGLPTVEGRRNKIGGEISLGVPAGALTVGPKLSGERASEYEREHRYQCVGNYWSTKHSAHWDMVYWDVRENRRTKHGIPDRLNVAVMVEREGKFTANVEVEVDTPIANGVFAFPWSRNSPVAFSPDVVMGQQPKTTKFEDLMDSDWKTMIPYGDEWENKMTEETLSGGSSTPVSGSAAE